MVVNMEIGMITPPVGLNLFVTSGVANDADDGRRAGGLAVPRRALRLPDHGHLHPVCFRPSCPTTFMGPEIITK